jgi:hypothetical protein
MSYLKHNSWGRTRSPKNVAGPPGTEAAVNVVGDLSDKSDGYATENQRFLHLLVGNGTADDSTAGARTITVYVYTHASGKWSKISDAGGSAFTLTAPDNNGTEATAGRAYSVFEIHGVDRVAFVGVAADTRVWASCSTF